MSEKPAPPAGALNFSGVRVYDHDSGEELYVQRIKVNVEPGNQVTAEITMAVASIEMPEGIRKP